MNQQYQPPDSGRVAIVHDWLLVQGGAEKVLDALLAQFPEADVFTVVDFLPEQLRGRLNHHCVTPSLIQRLPFAKRVYRYYLPLMPYAVEQFDLAGYDLVISSSHSVAKGVITHPGQYHLCYCHTPMRYAWDMKESYLRHSGMPSPLDWYMRRTLKDLRQWDYFTAGQVDHFIANSHHVAERIAKYYRRKASVIYPPIDLDTFPFNAGPREDFYLAVSRLVPYKRLDLIIEAFRQDGTRRLKVVGEGPERKRLEALAKDSPNIEMLGYQSDAELHQWLAAARAFIFAADEDFGILPVEAQACGTPVIAFGHGGARETVVAMGESPTGVLFPFQRVDSLHEAIVRFEARRFSPDHCREQARRFNIETFNARLQDALKQIPRKLPCRVSAE